MPLRKFELLSLVGRKKHHEGEPPAPATSVHSSSRPPYQPGNPSAFHASVHRSSATPSVVSSASALPPPAPGIPTAAEREGFYSVQYERLTPSVSQRPPVAGNSAARTSSFGHAPPPASSGVQYERLGPSSARLPSPPVQYERLGSLSARLPSPQYDRLTPTTSPAGGGSLLPRTHRSPVTYRQTSPLQYDPAAPIPPLNSAVRSASFPSPTTPSPPVLHPPVDIAPIRADAMRRDRKSQRSSLAPVAENGSPDVAMGNATPNSGSDKSTPFSLVMEEWMSQLRTPTPDVMLLPSPYDFNKGTPTPVEKMEDIRHIREALMPTPPQGGSQEHRQGTKSDEYVSANGQRPLVEDIASLCRDLISQEVSEQLARRLMKMGVVPQQLAAAMRKPHSSSVDFGGSENNEDYDDDADETASLSTASGKGKRRKMCTAEGCQNLSRSRGLCKAHGGGRRCSVEGCSRASQSGSLCITHGGGKRCTVEGCQKAAQSRGMCKAHGGGVRCRVEGCTKSSQGDGFCRTHGGGRRCGHPSGCTKWAQRNGMCMAHSEGKYGNSYRGRVARMQDGDEQSAAAALVGAANAPVS